MKKLISTIVVLALVLSMAATVFAADTVTVYCQAPEGWETCNVHWWGSSEGESSWPGDAMTKGDDGIWYATIPADVGGLLFNKAGDDGKTSDLTLPTDNKLMYVYGNNEWVEYGSKVEVVISYYVAGVSALCGSEWNPSDAANKMTEGENGVYTITYADVAAGSYEFKVTNGTWEQSWGADTASGNYELTVDAAADVTIIFDSVNQAISVDIDAGDAPVQPSEPSEEPSEPSEEPSEPSEPSETPSEPEVDETPDTVVVTAKVPSDWTAASIWAWGANGNAFDAWPGLAMTKDGDVYTAVIPSWVENVIINNGVADGALQTVDLTVTAGKDVTITLTTAGEDGKFAADVAYADGSTPSEPTPPAVDVSGEYRVVGDAEWLGAWDPANSVGLMTETSAGVYEITFKDVAVGEYQFKITKNGTWADNWGKDGYNTDNIALDVTVAGDVTIVFDANRAAISYKTAASDEMIPVTGDMGIAAVCAALLVASAGLVCVVNKKKEF